MIIGKYLENPALYSPDELERLDKHIEKYFGKATTGVHEFFSEDIHVDVSIIPPHEEHNYYTLVTTGMGAFSMKIPSEYQEDVSNHRKHLAGLWAFCSKRNAIR